MVPQINSRGQSFKGVTAYLMHDKEADTSERVDFTETRNLPFQDVERASRFMAWTDLSADALKQQHEQHTAQLEGRDPHHTHAGRPSEAGNVLHSSLAWHPDQKPTKEDMTHAADEWVKAQGWDEHQYYMVAHSDTKHAHIHIVVNLVHPVTGQIADQSHSKLKSDRWAQDYEERTGEIVCQNRDDKYKAWEQGKAAFSEKERKEEAGALIAQAYHASDSGAAFKAALEAQGFDLAQGQKRGFVVVDQRGDVYAPARHIEGVSGRDINRLLKEIDKSALPRADELQEQRQHFDRDAAEAKQQDALLEAAEEAARRKVAAEGVDPAEPFKAAAHDPYEHGSVVRTERRAQGVVTGFENGLYDVTFSNRRTGKEFTGQFKPDEIDLVRTPAQERVYQYERSQERAYWNNLQIARERQVRERIEERREYWQIARIENERDRAQTALDERSGWVNRYVLRWRYGEARDELEAKQKNLDHALDRWQTDIDAIQGNRTKELRRDLDKHGFFVGGKRTDEGLERAHAESKGEQQQKDEKTLREAQSSPQAAARLSSVVSPRSSEQRAAAAEIKDAAKDFEKARNERQEEEAEPQKLQRDMTPDELEELAKGLLADIEDRLAAGRDDAEEIEAESFDMEGEDKLQRDMSEAELEAYRDRLREIIVEAQSFEMEEGMQPQRRQEREIE
ncbi:MULTISPECIES: relaxase/mobilization nuclease domain-containing protein [unclassified Phaeobacter]|uniref:relaxase/mobilization nuclease domain-containing protein n=1 Tax=unclassified Phaeobacter TaxID=2621772 RepID=UPI003A8ABAD5